MYGWLIFLLLLWPLFWVIRVLLVTRLLMGLEFSKTRIQALPEAAVPPYLQEAAKPWVAQFEKLGFRPVGGWRLNSTTNAAFDEYAVALEKPGHPVLAIIQPYGESARSGECWASLRTTKVDGTEIVTSSHAPEELLPLAPRILVEVKDMAIPSLLLDRHLARVAAAGSDFWRCEDIKDVAVREQDVRDASLIFAIEQDLVTETGKPIYRYKIGAALRRAMAVLRRARVLKKNQRPSVRPLGTELSQESQVAFDLQHYRQQVALNQARFSLKVKTVITSVSFVIFAGVLAWQYSTVVAVTLLVALVVHECGHLLGMRWFGYRDTQLLFVPFFGGAAIGYDDKVLPPWQHVVIILLGPIPGIFIALVLLVYASGGDSPAWLTEAALTTLVLNAFNLLPILPLDGGQIVDYAFASRFPRVRVIFLAISALGMLLFGLAAGGAKLLFGVGIATLIRLPLEWRLAGLRRAVREEFPDGSEEEEPVVRSLILEMREPEWHKTPVAQRLQLVRGLQQVLRMVRPGIGTMCFALAGFTAPLWLGTPLALWAVMRQSDARLAQAHARAEAAGLTAVAPVAKAVKVAAEDNAAVPYEQARALVRGESEDEEETPSANKEKIVALLRTAAHKRAFVQSATVTKTEPHARFATWGNGRLLGYLAAAASERLRDQETPEAAAIAIDTLKLLRLMQAGPGVLHWYDYKFTAETGWTTIEAALAAGVKLSPAQIADLRRLCTEEADIAFAAATMPREMLPPDFTVDQLELGEAGPDTRKWVKLVQRVNPIWNRLQVESIDEAIVVHGLMQTVARGDWPQPEVAAGGPPHAKLEIAQLGDFIARKRQAKIALLLGEQRQRGAKITSLQALAAAPTDLVHPYTREPMRLTQRGSVDVLAFKGGVASTYESEDGAEAGELVWRVPSGPR